MPTRAVFRCQFCDATPDHGTQRSLQGQVSERMFGEYLDAFPGRWLVWNGGGPLGPRRYACREHRGDLVAYLRYHYATVAAQVWKMPPYEQRWPDEKRPHMGGSMGIIKFGLRGGLLEDKPPAKPPDAPDVEAPAAADPEPVASEQPPTDEPVSEPEPAAEPEAVDEPAAEPEPEPDGGQEFEFPPGALYLPEDMGGSEDASTDGFPPGDAFPDDPFPPGELFPPDDMFPPGELFPPTDGPDDAWPPGPPQPPGPPPEEPPSPTV